jgi:hypothetical protein
MNLYQASSRNELKWPFKNDELASFLGCAAWSVFHLTLHGASQKELSFFRFLQGLFLKGRSLLCRSGPFCFQSLMTNAVVGKISSCVCPVPMKTSKLGCIKHQLGSYLA